MVKSKFVPISERYRAFPGQSLYSPDIEDESAPGFNPEISGSSFLITLSQSAFISNTIHPLAES